MQDVGRVDILQTAKDLIDKGLEVRIGQGLARSDDSGKIAFHEFWQTISYVS
jgi:hypothetical protein